MMPSNDLQPDSPICAKCAGGDHFIVKRIEDDGAEATCAICGDTHPTIALSALAEMIDAIFQGFGRIVDPGEPGVQGSTPNEIIRDEILECESEVLADAIVDHLHDINWHDVRKGGTDWYDSMSEIYKIEVGYSSQYDDEWQQFVDGVKHRGRFYLDDEQAYLERILRPLLRGDLHKGQPPIVTIGKGSSIEAIYRGRPANTREQQQRIYENPAQQLAPPPPTLRTAGRMNAAGVVAFYGATDVDTCIAELRVPIGGAAVVGKFELLHPVRVLDFRLLSRSAIANFSWFDPEVKAKFAYRRFMRQLRNRLREPVLPGTETLEYLPTQMIAEYLARQGVNGAMFVSSLASAASEEYDEELIDAAIPMAGEKDIERATGINIVLFSGSAIVLGDPEASAHRVVKVDEPISFSGFPGWQSVYVVDEEPTEDEPEAYPQSDDAAEPTLRLLKKELILAVPRAIEYKVDVHNVHFGPAKEELPY